MPVTPRHPPPAKRAGSPPGTRAPSRGSPRLLPALFASALLALPGLSACASQGGPAGPELQDRDPAADEQGDTAVFEGNPLFWGADPAAHVWEDGRLWVYPTRGAADWDELTGWDAWSTEDRVTWVRHRDVFTADGCGWCENNAWAPDVAERDGRYFMYYYFRNDGAQPRGIGVAVSDEPGGPFENVTVDGPLVDGHDPSVLVEEDRAYLYTGHVIYFLNDDMTSLEMREDGRPRDVIVDLRGHDPVGGWEGVWVFEREGRYYYTLADEDYRQLRYYVGDGPTGPFHHAGELLHRVDGLNVHHSIVEHEGRWILFYHLWPEDGSGRRRVNAEFLEFREDGTIEPVRVTEEGISGG